MRSSSSSMRRLSAMTSRTLYPAPGLVTPKLAQLAVDLGVHVEGLLALAQTALVAGHDELANLLAEARVGAPRVAREGRQLGVDVQLGLAARHPPVGLRLEHLADLLLHLGAAGRRSRLARHVEAPLAAQPGVDAAGAPVRGGGDENGDHRDHDHDAAEVHRSKSPRMPWKRLRRRSMAPSRPLVYPDQIGLVVFTAIAIAVGIWAVFRYLL